MAFEQNAMNYSYKRLNKKDAGYFRELLGVFADAFDEPKTYLDAQPSDAYLISLLAKRTFITIAAFADGMVTGGLVAYQFDKFERERSEIYIYDLAVAPAHRRRGVATNLIKTLQRTAMRQKAWVIFVQADRGDVPALKLYESFGKKEPTYNFDIPVKKSPIYKKQDRPYD